jgi:hypothetical protein
MSYDWWAGFGWGIAAVFIAREVSSRVIKFLESV